MVNAELSPEFLKHFLEVSALRPHCACGTWPACFFARTQSGVWLSSALGSAAAPPSAPACSKRPAHDTAARMTGLTFCPDSPRTPLARRCRPTPCSRTTSSCTTPPTRTACSAFAGRLAGWKSAPCGPPTERKRFGLRLVVSARDAPRRSARQHAHAAHTPPSTPPALVGRQEHYPCILCLARLACALPPSLPAARDLRPAPCPAHVDVYPTPPAPHLATACAHRATPCP